MKTTSSQEIQRELDRVVETIVAKFDPEKVILFGSYAWGRPHADSDADLLVVTESELPYRERTYSARRAIDSHLLPIDLIIHTPTELQHAIKRQRNLFLEDVVTNGKVLYAKDAVRRPVAR